MNPKNLATILHIQLNHHTLPLTPFKKENFKLKHIVLISTVEREQLRYAFLQLIYLIL